MVGRTTMFVTNQLRGMISTLLMILIRPVVPRKGIVVSEHVSSIEHS